MDLQLSGHRKKLARWISEWNLDRILSKEPDRVAELSKHPVLSEASSIAETDAEIIPGDIRLLRPFPSSQSRGRPIYVLVASREADGTFLIVPFGKFSEPATPAEWRTGLRQPPLRVLCLWNSRTISFKSLSRTWYAGRVTTPRLMSVLKAIGNDPSSSAVELDRRGPPLRHPLDPRHAYLDEESSQFDEQMTFLEHLSTETPALYSPTKQETDILIAAEEKAGYGTGKKKKRKRSS